MKSRKISGGYLLRLERGEEAVSTLASFAAERRIPCGFLQGIGAIKNLEIGYFDGRSGQYRRRRLRKQVEVIGLQGNISWLDGKPFVHAHIAVAGVDNKVIGGHFFGGDVAVTLEILIKVFPKKLKRSYDPQVGFNFWDL
jgi:predicted DNA-binding protein with PD1-like motif